MSNVRVSKRKNKISKQVMTILLSLVMLALVVMPASAMADSTNGGGSIWKN
jgi:hypothetical protein